MFGFSFTLCTYYSPEKCKSSPGIFSIICPSVFKIASIDIELGDKVIPYHVITLFD